MQLTLSQDEALAKLLDSPARLRTLSGAAGTGKTTLIKELEKEADDAVVCTPTNKAAQVLLSKGIDATTFFKKFYILENKPRRGQKPHFISCRRFLEQHPRYLGNFHAHQHLLPEGKVAWVENLIIDEASMVTSRMANEMARMCQNLILVGDKNQLPPVNDADHPAGFFCELEPTAELTEVLRQAEGSLILQLASEIRDRGPKVDKMLRHFEPSASFQELVKRGAQMIAFTNKERQRINHVCRKILGFSRPVPLPGDRLLVTNNYSDDLVNGTVVEVVEFKWDGVNPYGSLAVLMGSGDRVWTTLDMHAFARDQIASQQSLLSARLAAPPDEGDTETTHLEATFAYCLTAHKAQGSEWDEVVVFDQRPLIRKVQAADPRAGMHPDEYVRRWLYTAVTRARKTLHVAPTWFAQSYEQVI